MTRSRYFLDDTKDHYILWSSFTHDAKATMTLLDKLRSGYIQSVDDQRPQIIDVRHVAMLVSKVRRLSPNKPDFIQYGVMFCDSGTVWTVSNPIAREQLEMSLGDAECGQDCLNILAVLRYYHRRKGQLVVCIDFRPHLHPYNQEEDE